jgi:HAD superfamily hydrolase (TIGR01509 family)
MTPTRPGRLADMPLARLPDPVALLFDLDGTLVDTVHLRVAAWIEAFRRLDVPVDRDRLPEYMGSDGRWLAAENARAAGREIDWATADRLDRLSGEIFDQLNVDTRPLPGATELLTALESVALESVAPGAARGPAFCIATASQPAQVAASIAALRLPWPPRVVDAGHVVNAKPEPDLLLAAAAQLGVAPAGCWYVGDSRWDMMAAVRAGTAAVGVTTGATGGQKLLAAGAAAVVDGLAEVARELSRRGLIGA